MSKKNNLNQLVNLMTKALRHKIGSLVNSNEFYAGKYAKDVCQVKLDHISCETPSFTRDAENIMKEAEKVLLEQHWNNHDKVEIKKQLRKKLEKELEEKEFLDNKKFEIMDKEIKKALADFELG